MSRNVHSWCRRFECYTSQERAEKGVRCSILARMFRFVGADPSLMWISHVQVGEFVRTDLSLMWIPRVQVQGLVRTDLSLKWIPRIQVKGLVGSGPSRTWC